MASDLVVVEQQERALVPSEAGTFALAVMTDQEFETRLTILKKGRDRIARIHRELMVQDVDYGKIPGTDKPTLFQPGAELLCNLYHFVPDLQPTVEHGDGVTAPHIRYVTRCELHLGTTDGPVIAVGIGAANSWERKHRYRMSERACPSCGVLGTILRSKTGKAEWFCWRKKGGCGATFPLNDPKITEQHAGMVENPDPHDLEETLLQMSGKRALVAATRRATASSGLFTQDVEDMPVPPEEPVEETQPQPRTLREAVRETPAQPTDEQTARAATSEDGAVEVAHELAATEASGYCLMENKTLDTGACEKPAGHGGAHRNATGSWPA